MKKFLFLFSLLVTQVSFAATAQVSNVDNVGGSNFPALTQPVANHTLITLMSGTNSAAASVTYVFQKAGGTTQGAYQITAGKTFVCVGAWVKNANGWGLGQSSGAATHGGAAPTGPVYYNALGALSANGALNSGLTGVTGGEVWIPLQGVTFTAAYYPFWYSEGGGITVEVRLIGYEI